MSNTRARALELPPHTRARAPNACADASAAPVRKPIVDWQLDYDASVVAESHLAPTRHRALAHLFNEPVGDDLPNVNVRAHGAYHCGKSSYCGIAMATATERPIKKGDELVWCYGALYKRHYEVSSACRARESTAIGPKTKLEHATDVLTRGQYVGKVARHEFHQNCEAIGLAGGEGGREMIDHLFDEWDQDESDYLEVHEVEKGVASLEE